MRFRNTACLVLVLTACSAEPLPEAVDRRQDSIVYGDVDNSHDAVVTIFSNNSKCSGTIVHVAGNQGFALTAAHCVDQPPEVVVQADNYAQGSPIQYPVVEYEAHQDYDGAYYDFAMIRFSAAGAATPVIPAMTDAEDNIANGTQLDIIGFGQTQNGDTSQRHHKVLPVFDETQLHLVFDQSNGGMCFGDSGGPAIGTAGGQERVGGVNASVTDQSCVDYGIAGRVSAVTDTFIVPFINNAPVGVQTCDQCFESSTNGVGGCVATVEACFDNAECAALVQCLNGCQTQVCAQQCGSAHPQGIAPYEAISDCVCTQTCVSECQGEAFCAEPACGFTSQSAACQGCFETSCCAQASACADSPSCALCFSQSPGPNCASDPLVVAFSDCLQANCTDDCGLDPGTGGGGPTSTSSTGSGGPGSTGTGGAPGATGTGTGAATGPTTTGAGGAGADDDDGGNDPKAGDADSTGGCATSAPAEPRAWLALALALASLVIRRRR